MIHLASTLAPNQSLLFILVSRRENFIYSLLKDLRDSRVIAELWFISMAAQRETQMGGGCLLWICARNFQGFVFVCLFLSSSGKHIFRLCGRIFLTI